MQDIQQSHSPIENEFISSHFFAGSEVAMVLQLADGSVQAYNQGFENVLGLTRQQLAQWTFTDLTSRAICESGCVFSQENYPAIIALKTGKSCSKVIGVFNANGEIMWLSVTAQALFKVGDESPYGVVTTFTDITTSHCVNSTTVSCDCPPSKNIIERKQIEAKLRAAYKELEEIVEQRIISGENQERQFASILANIPHIICRFDTQMRYIYVNPAIEAITGIASYKFIGKAIFEMGFSPDEISIWHHYLQEVLITKREISHEFSFSSVSGIRYYYATVIPEFDTDGEIVSILTVCRDMTERKQIEFALQESELNFRTLADTMPQMFWTTQADGYHDYFNQRWYEYTGMTLEETQGWGWSHLLHPDDYEKTLQTWNESLRTGKDYNVEYRFLRQRDGEYRWFLGRAFALKNEKGEIVRWFGSCTDIHDQKCALEERDAALTRERKARSQLEAANRVKDEFLAVLSHELRSPLNPILGWTKILQTRKLDEAGTKRALQTIERNAQLQTRLIDDLLDVSRILRGKLSLNVANINLISTIEAAIETIQLAADTKLITIHKSFTLIQGEIKGDSSRVQQIIWNLLSNAVKFTPSGGKIEIKLEQVGNHAQITVSDTGKGINPDFLPFVFDYFRQADSTTTRTFGGLGLGLAIVHHLTELHGGTVQAHSLGEGQGATFTVMLPIYIPQQPLLEDLEYSPLSINTQDTILSGIKILLVEDEPDSREIQTVMLEEFGAEVISVSSAQQALEILQQSKLHILISDIGMPLMDGYELLRQIRLLPPEKNGLIPAIALTAYASDTDQEQAMAAGYQIHLAKPFEPLKLAITINKLLGI